MPGHRTACCLLRPTPHILLVSSQVTVGGGGIPPPYSLCQPCLVAQSGRVLGCMATLWPAVGLGPPAPSGAARLLGSARPTDEGWCL